MRDDPANRNNKNATRRTRRDEIFDYICDYADVHGGPTPSIREIAMEFHLNYSTVYRHIKLLIDEDRIDQRNGKIVVIGSRWIAPDDE